MGQGISEMKDLLSHYRYQPKGGGIGSWDKFSQFPAAGLGSSWKMSLGPELITFFINFVERKHHIVVDKNKYLLPLD
jgi:hypothetical protein